MNKDQYITIKQYLDTYQMHTISNRIDPDTKVIKIKKLTDNVRLYYRPNYFVTAYPNKTICRY